MQYHKRTETASKLKKFYSAMAQAIKLAEIENGTPASQWKNKHTVSTTSWVRNRDGRTIWFDYIQKYLPIGEKIEIVDDWSNEIFPFNDGTAISGFNSSEICPDYGTCNGYTFDTNGPKGPNEMGRDRFGFWIFWDKSFAKYPNAKTFDSAKDPQRLKQTSAVTREELLEDCKKHPIYCTSLIMYDGWEIKSDYPYKL